MEASLYLDTQGVLTGEPIFTGQFTDACRLVWSLTPIARRYARIESGGWTYPAGELESMPAEDLGEI